MLIGADVLTFGNKTEIMPTGVTEPGGTEVEQLKAIREGRGLSRARVAVLSGLNPATITRIENGERSPTVETLEKLAAALDIEVGDFFPKVRPSSELPGDGADSYAYGDEVFYDERSPAAEGLEFTEYLWRLEDLINQWSRTLFFYSHPERPTDASVQRLHLDWATYRLEETCRKLVSYLEEERRARSGPQRDQAASEEPPGRAVENHRDPEVRVTELRSDS